MDKLDSLNTGKTCRFLKIELVVDRLVMKEGLRSRLTDSVETALRESEGSLSVVTVPRDGR